MKTSKQRLQELANIIEDRDQSMPRWINESKYGDNPYGDYLASDLETDLVQDAKDALAGVSMETYEKVMEMLTGREFTDNVDNVPGIHNLINSVQFDFDEAMDEPHIVDEWFYENQDNAKVLNAMIKLCELIDLSSIR